MRYINETDLREIGIDWEALSFVIRETAAAYAAGECVQPIKPYLRFGDERNRIIAMPAYTSRPLRAAGLKWIASYPANIEAGLPRAHSITVLNDPDTGQPAALFSGSLISAIRTAAVSGTLLRTLIASGLVGGGKPLEVAIIGSGPIGRMHADMLREWIGASYLSRIRVFDERIEAATKLAAQAASAETGVPVEIVPGWREAYRDADVVLTCTASPTRYIDEPAKPGALLLHVSLRDYTAPALVGVGPIVVDSWEEVCRADTDIERMHVELGLEREDTIALSDVLADAGKALAGANEGKRRGGGPILFAPMGLAVFDIAVAAYYVKAAERLGIGQLLD
ncbi:2,3-diaminopropionate biosynthesis protein SbnB [Paenibacillus sp. NPDC058071]|uniref:2,3-diaminopropionate biosynthesis protein SbnB n=1 Tax=Paenibacillus sp. NPDC058071 TaxID=3346326 RepID=UPI0036D896CF